jgi:hypothetical protein
MKALGVLASKWDPIRKKLVRRLLEEQEHKREGRRARGRTGAIARAGNMSNGTCMREDGARGSWSSEQLASVGRMEIGGVLLVYYFLRFS